MIRFSKQMSLNTVTYITYISIVRVGTGLSFFGSETVEILEKLYRYVFHFLTKSYDEELK